MSYIFLFVLGLAVGSFLNVLIDRLPREESIKGRSHCDDCKKTLSWNDLIPILSYVGLRGKCRYCKTNLSWQYPFIELLTTVIFVYILLNMHVSFLRTAAYLGIVSTAIVI